MVPVARCNVLTIHISEPAVMCMDSKQLRRISAGAGVRLSGGQKQRIAIARHACVILHSVFPI